MSQVKNTFQEVMFDLFDAAEFGYLPPDFKSWKEFVTCQADKMGAIESVLFPEGDE